MLGKVKKMSLSAWMIIALLLGIISGAICNQMGIDTTPIKPLGDLFINMVKMLVVPLLLATIISGTASMNNMRKLGRVAVKAILLYCITMCIAMLMGIIVANIVKPGIGISLAIETGAVKGKAFTGVLQTILNIVPSNIVQAMASGNLLALIFFSVLFGICAVAVGEKAKQVNDFIKSFTEIMFKMTSYVMMYAPIGSFALICYTVGHYGLAVLLPLGKLILTLYGTIIAFILLVYVPMVCVNKFSVKPSSQYSYSFMGMKVQSEEHIIVGTARRAARHQYHTLTLTL